MRATKCSALRTAHATRSPLWCSTRGRRDVLVSSSSIRITATAEPSSVCSTSRFRPQEAWRAKPFPIIKDLVVDREAFDRIIASGGYVSVCTGSAPDANEIPIPKEDADEAFDYAACIGCGACVAACKNASAMLFTAAKFAHLEKLPQGRVESDRRALAMVQQHDAEGFGGCTNQYECEAVCPKEIKVSAIARLNRVYNRAKFKGVEV